MTKELKEGTDYYIDKQGRWVFTSKYLLERGYCCKNGCLHCPYGFKKSKTFKLIRPKQ
ncbi:MAG: hypothetical protein IPM47_21480 [Sphingobacteriales bacterium]|nr:MAG: hypothetical protein IPM47_21480 [Sphingobacteriales bacterium]